MKHASLPMGAVEIGTIAEAETDDEEDEEVIEGNETKDFQEQKHPKKGHIHQFNDGIYASRNVSVKDIKVVIL